MIDRELVLKQINELQAIKTVMQTKQGRSVMFNILERCGVYRSIMTGSSKTFYLAGKQDMGHEILALLLQADPESYKQMETEHLIKGESHLENLQRKLTEDSDGRSKR